MKILEFGDTGKRKIILIHGFQCPQAYCFVCGFTTVYVYLRVFLFDHAAMNKVVYNFARQPC